MKQVRTALAGSVLLLVASAGATAGKPGQAYLGVHVRVESERPGGGARVERVVTGSPAERAGIEVRDVIVRFRGHEISDPVQLKEAVLACAPGQRVEVEWIRGGESRVREIELAERRRSAAEIEPDSPGWWLLPDEEWLDELADHSRRWADEYREWRETEGSEWVEAYREWAESFRERLDDWRDQTGELPFPWPAPRPRLGVQVVDTTPELRRHLGGRDDAGVLVGRVLAGMPAERAGLRVGDLILSLDGRPVAGAGDLIEALSETGAGTVRLELVRQGRTLTLEAELPDVEADEAIRGPRAAGSDGRSPGAPARG